MTKYFNTCSKDTRTYESQCLAQQKELAGKKRTDLSSASSNYVLDSSAWIEYLDGTPKGEKIKHIIEQEEHSTSILAIAEIADRYARIQKPFQDILTFIQSRTTLLPLTVPITVIAAHLKRDIRKKNNKFGIADAIHLATAHQHKAVLITTDADFRGCDKVMLI